MVSIIEMFIGLFGVKKLCGGNSTKKTLRSKSQRLMLLDFGKVVGLDEVFDELFQFFRFEAKECDDVKTFFFGNGVVNLVSLDETTNLGELLL